MGISNYFHDNWNKLDFILVIVSLLMSVTLTVVRVTKNLMSSRGIRFIRYTRWNRGLRVVKWGKKNK
jgi:hypothetical protein